MDNPNASRRVRRMNTLPSKLQRHVSLLPKKLQLNNNPYVGSFRHSPPSNFHSMVASGHGGARKFSIASSPAQGTTMRTSPYIGWFRHAPPSRMHEMTKPDVRLLEKYRSLAMIVGRMALRKKTTRSSLAHLLNAYACRSGGKVSYCMDAGGSSQDVSTFPKSAQAVDTGILAKLTSWFPMTHDLDFYNLNDIYYKQTFQAFLEDSKAEDSESESDDDEHDLNDGDEESSTALSDFDAPMTAANATKSPLPSSSLNLALSEIAESYYSHHTGVVDEAASYDMLAEESRLDYVITQGDIVRMARNAARHLDVESILNLPTVTYRSHKAFTRSKSRQTPEESRDPSESWSFIMIPPASSMEESSVTEPTSNNVNDTVCVICLENFKDGDRLRVLPCNHSFHVGCIDRWLSGSVSHGNCVTSGCPTCKKRPGIPSIINTKTTMITPINIPIPESIENDGSVPSWAFAELGSQLAQSLDA